MTIENLNKIVTVLMNAEASGSIDAQHDVLYLPWTKRTGMVADALLGQGCHWSSEGECWAIFT